MENRIKKIKSDKLTLSVVIPTYNRPHLAFNLAKQIRKLHKNKYQIIIVDQENRNPPDKKIVEELKVGYFNLPKANTSLAKNKGFHVAKGDIVVFFDDDVEITDKTLSSHLEAYDDQNVAGVAGRVINDGEEVPNKSEVETGASNFLSTKFVYNFWSTKKQIVDFVYGCNMSFRKKVLDKIGGFDKDFSKIFEEVDLSRRLKKEGQILFQPDALVYHHKAKSGGIRKEEKQKENLIYENYGNYIAKHVPFPFSIITLILRVITALKTYPPAVFSLLNGYKKRLNFLSIFSYLIVIFLIFIRFYRAPDFFSFNFDEEYQAHLAFEQVKNFHLIWIGVSASNIGFYLGPGFTYLNALLFKLTNGDPVSLAYFAPLMGVATGLSLYFVANQIFNKKVAFLSMIFYLGSTLINFYDRRFWNPLPIPFITIWLFYSLFKAQKDNRYFILTSFLLAASLHVHLALLVFWPVVLFFVIKNLKKISFKTWVISIGLYLIIISPLIVFDFVHNFDNLMTPLRYIQNKNIEHQKVTAATINSHWHVWIASLSRYWYIKPVTDIQNEQCLGQQCLITPGKMWLSLLSLTSIFYLIFKSFKDRKKQYLILMTAFSMIFFVFYPGYSAEYYLLNFFVLFPIILGLFFEKLPNWLTIIVVSLFIIFNSLTIINSTQTKFGLNTKKIGIKKVMKVIADRPYALENYGKDPRKYHSYGGWRYLFRIYGKKPTRAFADEFFGWIYQNEITDEKPIYRVVVSEDIEYNKSIEKPVLKFKEGAYYFYVFKY